MNTRCTIIKMCCHTPFTNHWVPARLHGSCTSSCMVLQAGVGWNKTHVISVPSPTHSTTSHSFPLSSLHLATAACQHRLFFLLALYPQTCFFTPIVRAVGVSLHRTSLLPARPTICLRCMLLQAILWPLGVICRCLGRELMQDFQRVIIIFLPVNHCSN